MLSTKSLVAADVPPANRVRILALLTVDMQNDFVRVGAPLEVPSAQDTVPSVRKLIHAYRQRRRPVVYTRFLARQSPDLLWLWWPQLAPETRCRWDGFHRTYGDTQEPLDCAAVISELAPDPDDIVVDKHGYGAFHGTDLDNLLRGKGVESFLVTGPVTQICAEETAREAFHRGYRTTMISDDVSSFAPDLQAATLSNFGMKFGWVADTNTALSWF